MQDVVVRFYRAEDLTERTLYLFGAELGPAAHTIPHILDEFTVCLCVSVAAVQCWQVAVHELSRAGQELVDALDDIILDINVYLETF